ncbi:hypothetical protein PRIPAC_91137, partial [Pristionchus pacificus]
QSNVKLDASAIEKQRQDQLEYELAKTDLTFVRNHALDIADRRERFAWESLATGTLLAALCVWGSFMKRKDFIIPCVPLVLGAGYRYENSYGEQLETLRDNAERLLQESPQLLTRPGGPITMAEIDRLRGQMYGSA